MLLIVGMWSLYGVKKFKEIACSINIKLINLLYKVYITSVIMFLLSFIIIESMIFVTVNDYHLLRSRIIACILGLENEGLPSKSSLSGKLYYAVREYPAMITYIVKVAIFRLCNIS